MSYDSLDVFAEIGAALAGFATIAGVLQSDINQRHNAFGVVQVSLLTMLLSLLPRLVPDIRVAAFFFLVSWSALWVITGIRNSRFTGVVVRVPQPFFVTGSAFVLACAGSALAVAILLGLWPELASTLYGWCLMCGLLTASLFLAEVARTIFIASGDSAGSSGGP